MKTIAFVGQNNDKVFKSNVLGFIEALGIKYRDISKDIPYNEKYSDYIIMNSCINISAVTLNCGYCLANMDTLLGNKISINGNLITYGFGSKNTVTISSVKDENDGFVYCLQRYIHINDLQGVEPQEIPIEIEFEEEEELYSYMVAITISLIEGINNKKRIEKKLNNEFSYK
ncbi:hypothetical protein [Clostridium ganghwense]|uniref:Uncharacterized protein n=1 Tax=Clostridium ganghwense TaxID=312089 RepID=A0ABT4CR69_9CLOT|nr:hypothetical protein [Clostridium ganghwense]MCY6370576.1 hypothetical protein [Clostridium ganghwense]